MKSKLKSKIETRQVIFALAVLMTATLAFFGSVFLTPMIAQEKTDLKGEIATLFPGAPQSIAMGSNRDGNNEVYVMNPDGSGQTNKTNNTNNDQRPDISPDGSQIVFSSNRDGNFEIFIMNSDGNNVRQLTFTASPVANSWPRWSPSGEWVAFQSGSGTNFQIYRIRPDGTDLTQVTNYVGLNQFPGWAPDGTRLAIRRDTEIYLIDSLDGSNPVRLTFTDTISGAFNQMASFSPDGTKIAYLSNNRDTPSDPLYLSVYIMDSDGGNKVNFTPKPVGYAGTWTSRAPAWSADGQYIYFTAVRSVTAGSLEQIFVKPAGGGVETQLTTAGANFEATVRRAFAPTAASVPISGRVMSTDGSGIFPAYVSITASSGIAHTSRANNFGYYRFDDIEVGQTYVVSVTAKQRQFVPRVVFVKDELANFDLIALP